MPLTGDSIMQVTHHELIHVSGTVQGVGFRYQTLQVSREYDVAGYVRNLPDGRVEIEVEGTRAEIEAFVEAVAERMHGYIRKMERQATEGAPKFSGFSIR